LGGHSKNVRSIRAIPSSRAENSTDGFFLENEMISKKTPDDLKLTNPNNEQSKTTKTKTTILTMKVSNTAMLAYILSAATSGVAQPARRNLRGGRRLAGGIAVAGSNGEGQAAAGGVYCNGSSCKGATITASKSDDSLDVETHTYGTRDRKMAVGVAAAGTNGDGDAAVGGVYCNGSSCKGATVTASKSDDSLDIETHTYGTRDRNLGGVVVAGRNGNGQAGAAACDENGCKGATINASTSSSDDSADIQIHTYSTRARKMAAGVAVAGGTNGEGDAAAGGVACDENGCKGATVTATTSSDSADIQVHKYSSRKMAEGVVVAGGTNGDGNAAAGGVACDEDGCKGATVTASASDDSADIHVNTYSSRNMAEGFVVGGASGNGNAAVGGCEYGEGCKGATVAVSSSSDDGTEITVHKYETGN